MKTETQKTNGRPDPGLQTKDRETAGTESVLKVEKPCMRMQDVAVCISRKGYLCLLSGPCEPCDWDGNVYPVIDASDLEELQNIQREDRADRVRADKEDEEPIIDAETQQAAMGIRGAAAAIQGTMFADREPFDPRKTVKDLVGS
jgi:hypothetical protein